MHINSNLLFYVTSVLLVIFALSTQHWKCGLWKSHEGHVLHTRPALRPQLPCIQVRANWSSVLSPYLEPTRSEEGIFGLLVSLSLKKLGEAGLDSTLRLHLSDTADTEPMTPTLETRSFPPSISAKRTEQGRWESLTWLMLPSSNCLYNHSNKYCSHWTTFQL